MSARLTSVLSSHYSDLKQAKDLLLSCLLHKTFPPCLEFLVSVLFGLLQAVTKLIFGAFEQ